MWIPLYAYYLGDSVSQFFNCSRGIVAVSPSGAVSACNLPVVNYKVGSKHLR